LTWQLGLINLPRCNGFPLQGGTLLRCYSLTTSVNSDYCMQLACACHVCTYSNFALFAFTTFTGRITNHCLSTSNRAIQQSIMRCTEKVYFYPQKYCVIKPSSPCFLKKLPLLLKERIKHYSNNFKLVIRHSLIFSKFTAISFYFSSYYKAKCEGCESKKCEIAVRTRAREMVHSTIVKENHRRVSAP